MANPRSPQLRGPQLKTLDDLCAHADAAISTTRRRGRFHDETLVEPHSVRSGRAGCGSPTSTTGGR